MPKISDDQLKLHFGITVSVNPVYAETVKLYQELKVHAEGIFPGRLLEKRRPSEPEEILEYRRDTYEPITKLPISKAINCYSKIRRSPDWMISFPKDTVSGRIPEEETLEQYCTENLPGFVSITNWAFDILLPQNLIDANALIAVIPLEPIVENAFCKPVPILFNSDQVMFYSEQEKYAILRSRISVNYLDALNVYQPGARYFYIDDREVIIYEQGKDGYQQTFKQPHNLGQFPVFKVRSEAYKQYDNISINRSRLHAMVPFLNKAAAGDSDLEGSKVQHLYPLFWYYQNKECKACNGTSKVPADGDGPPTICKTCDGTGKIKFSPFAHIQVDAAGLGAQSNPTPPAGYISRDVAILELQEKMVEKNNYKALAAINMQFLDQTPLAISGDAKQVDREELNNTVYNTAEDIVASVDKVIFFINEWRYGYIIPDQKARKAMMPNIPVPQNFDLLPADYLMDELSNARKNNANPFLLASLEKQIAVKKFYNDPELQNCIDLYFTLDPLPGMTADEKMTLLSNNGITQEDYILSNYMPQFIRRAVIDNNDFEKKTYDQQMDILKAYAKEKKDVTDAAAQMIQKQKQGILAEMKAAGGAAPAAAAK